MSAKMFIILLVCVQQVERDCKFLLLISHLCPFSCEHCSVGQKLTCSGHLWEHIQPHSIPRVLHSGEVTSLIDWLGLPTLESSSLTSLPVRSTFKQIVRFTMALLLEILFWHRYLVTFSNVVDNPDDPQNVVVWDISTGEKKRTFSKLPSEDWPTLK